MVKKSFKNDNPALSFISVAEAEVEVQEAPAEEVKATTPKSNNKKEVPEGYKLNPEFIETKSKRVQLLMQPSVLESARALAREKGMSLNELIAEAVKDYLQREGR